MGHPDLFNAAGIVYGVCFLAFAGLLLSPRGKLDAIPVWLSRAAWALHTGALISRWLADGWRHPPWTTFYEILAFGAWGVMAAYVFMDFKYRSRWVGLLTTLTAFVALLLAALAPGKGPELLVPAMQSRWLLIHVPSGILAYGFFALSAFLGFLYLVRAGVKTEAFLLGVSGLALGVVPWASGRIGGGEAFAVPAVTPLISVALLLFLFHFVSGLLTEAFVAPAGKKGGVRGGGVVPPGESLDRVRFALRWIFIAAAAMLFAIVAVLLWANGWALGFRIRMVPFNFAGMLFMTAIAGVAVLLMGTRPRFEQKLAPVSKIDRLTYQAVLAGFPLMTLNLVTGGVWAYFAWGRYWGWDPKEIWALATWIVYAIYLLIRARGEGGERKAAGVAILGFFVAVFAFLGVSLLLPGTHSLYPGG